MAITANGLYSERARDMFGMAQSAAIATTSPTAVISRGMEVQGDILTKVASYTREQVVLLKQQIKLLGDIKRGQSSWGITDALMSKLFIGLGAKIFGGVSRVGTLVGGAVAGAVGASSRLFSGITTGVVTGVSKLTGFLSSGITSMVSKVTGLFTGVFETIPKIIAAVGRPIQKVFSTITSLNFGGLLEFAGGILGSASKVLGVIAKIGSKFLLPIAALFTAFDAFKGFTNADSILGRDNVGLVGKLGSSISTAVNGLLLGIPDWISDKLGFKNFAQMVDAGGIKLGEYTGKMVDAVSNMFGTITDYVTGFVGSITTAIGDAWEAAKTYVASLGTWVKDSIKSAFGLGPEVAAPTYNKPNASTASGFNNTPKTPAVLPGVTTTGPTLNIGGGLNATIAAGPTNMVGSSSINLSIKASDNLDKLNDKSDRMQELPTFDTTKPAQDVLGNLGELTVKANNTLVGVAADLAKSVPAIVAIANDSDKNVIKPEHVANNAISKTNMVAMSAIDAQQAAVKEMEKTSKDATKTIGAVGTAVAAGSNKSTADFGDTLVNDLKTVYEQFGDLVKKGEDKLLGMASDYKNAAPSILAIANGTAPSGPGGFTGNGGSSYGVGTPGAIPGFAGGTSGSGTQNPSGRPTASPVVDSMLMPGMVPPTSYTPSGPLDIAGEQPQIPASRYAGNHAAMSSGRTVLNVSPNDEGMRSVLQQDRAGYAEALKDPQMRSLMAAYVEAEGGSFNPVDRQKMVESFVNRGVAQGKGLTRILNPNSGYFPASTTSKIAGYASNPEILKKHSALIDDVMAGSNYSNLATGNESAGVRSGGAAISSYSSAEERYVLEKGTEHYRRNVLGRYQQNAGTGEGTAQTTDGRVWDSKFNPTTGGTLGSSVQQAQLTSGAIRNKGIDQDVMTALDYASKKNGVIAVVGSGGQDRIGTGNRRTGSTRHDDGGAADVKFMMAGPDGKPLLDAKGKPQFVDMSTHEGRAKMSSIVADTASMGMTGFGAGRGYMGDQTIHIGKGSVATWGAEKGWLAESYRKGSSSPVNPKDWAKTQTGVPADIGTPDEGLKNSNTVSVFDRNKFFGQGAPTGSGTDAAIAGRSQIDQFKDMSDMRPASPFDGQAATPGAGKSNSRFTSAFGGPRPSGFAFGETPSVMDTFFGNATPTLDDKTLKAAGQAMGEGMTEAVQDRPSPPSFTPVTPVDPMTPGAPPVQGSANAANPSGDSSRSNTQAPTTKDVPSIDEYSMLMINSSVMS